MSLAVVPASQIAIASISFPPFASAPKSLCYRTARAPVCALRTTRQLNEGPGDPERDERGPLCSTLGGYPRNRRSLYGNRMPIRQAVPLMQVKAIEIIDPLDRASPMPLRRTSRTIEDRMD